MSRLGFQAAAALLLLACGVPLSAQEPAPQPFLLRRDSRKRFNLAHAC
jgi:hypothetical protein